MLTDDVATKCLVLTGLWALGFCLAHEYTRLCPARHERNIFRHRRAVMWRAIIDGEYHPTSLAVWAMIVLGAVLSGEHLMQSGKAGAGALLQGMALMQAAWCMVSVLRRCPRMMFLRVVFSAMAGVLFTRTVWLGMLLMVGTVG